jgi:integrase
MRLGECLAMKRDHLDPSNAQYMVSETIRRDHYGLPKTGKRLLDVPKEVVEKLVRYANGLRAKALAEGGEASYFFSGITHRLVQGAMKRACHAARLRVRHPHDLRHSYASILLSQGVSVMYVKKQLGHHSITMTVDIYGHWIPGEQKLDLGRLLRGETDSPIMLRRVK